MTDADNAPLLTMSKVRAMDDTPEGRVYLAMVPHGWGKNSNATRALSIAKRNGSYNDTAEGIIINAPTDAYVDDMGWMHWSDGTQKTEVVGRVKLTTKR